MATKRLTAQFNGQRISVPVEYWTLTNKLAPILLGLTVTDVPLREASKWALARAVSLAMQVSAEAKAFRG